MKLRPDINIRAKIIACCVVLLLCVAGFSGSVIFMSSQLGNMALALYDNAFVAVNYAYKVQVAFVRLKGPHTDADVPFTADDDTAEITSMLNNLDVANERATTPKEHEAAAAARAALASLVDTRPGADHATLAQVDKKLKRLTQRLSDDAFERRNDAEAVIDRLKKIVVGMAIAALIGAAGLAWFLIATVITPIRKVITLIEQTAADGFNAAPALLNRRDEIGQMVRALGQQQEAANALEAAPPPLPPPPTLHVKFPMQ